MALKFLDPSTQSMDADGFRCAGEDGERSVRFEIPRHVLKRHVMKPEPRDRLAEAIIAVTACHMAYQRRVKQFSDTDESVLIRLEDADFEDPVVLKMKDTYDQLREERVAASNANQQREEQ
jgi:hypothetical protein